MRRLRADFPILNRPLAFGGKPRTLVYLDNAATAQKPRAVLDAMTGYYENANANVHRAIHSLGEEATRIYEGARDKVQKFLNAASREEIVFTKGTTDSINLVASSFCRLLSPGDEIIATEMEHHANLVPWQMAASQYDLKLKFLPVDDRGVLQTDRLAELWSDRVKLVTVTAMSNVLGTINPVADIIAFAHGRGVPVLVDGAQSVPHQKVDVRALDCDFLAFSSHKMGGPTGFGVLYAKKTWLEKMPPYQGGGDMIRSVWLERFEPNVLPYKFEAGTPHMEGAAGLAAAIDYLEAVGMDWIHGYEQRLLDYTMEKLEGIPGLRIFGTAPGKGGILAFLLNGVHAHDLSAFLDSRGIAVRAGHHCAHPLARRFGIVSTARASFWFYNTIEEADAFVAAVREAVDKL
ncbi:MAG TPA: cysteine desulfurase [Spirochaetia bacterium]|nr:cysteine desulfurase [Spirochaetia bacterium]